jgi:hypothetical protein
MRELERNKRTVYYALFDKNEPILDEDGNDTGEVMPNYLPPVQLRINVSPAAGESATRQFGEILDYDRTLVTCDVGLSIDEKTVFWIDETDTTKPFDYTVKKVAKSLNSLQIAVKKVEVSFGA